MKRTLNILSGLKKKIRGRGPTALLKALLRKLWTLIYLRREFIIFCGDMTTEQWFKNGDAPPKYSPTIDAEIRIGSIDDLDKFNGVVSQKKIELFREWFKRGYDLFLAIHNGKVVYYQWLAYSDFYDAWNGIMFSPAPDEVVPVDIYTVPTFKNKNLHLAADSLTIAHCKEIGRYKMIAITSPEKFPLLKIMYKRTKFAGVHPIKRGVYYKYLNCIKRHTYE
ncbi:MAG: hypothetical protein IME98_01920 [Proteobacteria bacterium]|nr:hypothetical protein [Pseudomonadota bacterium]